MSSKIDNIIHRNFLNKNQKIENVHTYINKIQYLQSSDLQIKSDNAFSAQTHVFGEQWLSPKVIIYKSRLKLLFFLLPFIFLRHNGSCEVHTFMERRRGCRWQGARLWRNRIEGYIRWIGNRTGSWQGRVERAEWAGHGAPVTGHGVNTGQGDSSDSHRDGVIDPQEANVADKL